MKYFIDFLIFCFGLLAGRFVNTGINCLPERKKPDSMFQYTSCTCKVPWYYLLPVIGYIFSSGTCKKCGKKISVQYPVIELSNGILWVIAFYFCGMQITVFLYCLLLSALLLLSVIDWRTYEIPVEINYFIGILGVMNIVVNRQEWLSYVIGFFSVGLFLYLLYQVSKGGAIGGGDVKLMAFAGLILGWKLILLSFFLGCIIGSVIHLIRMKLSDQGHMLAMGPYLALGIAIALLFGNDMIHWYIGLCLA